MSHLIPIQSKPSENIDISHSSLYKRQPQAPPLLSQSSHPRKIVKKQEDNNTNHQQQILIHARQKAQLSKKIIELLQKSFHQQLQFITESSQNILQYESLIPETLTLHDKILKYISDYKNCRQESKQSILNLFQNGVTLSVSQQYHHRFKASLKKIKNKKLLVFHPSYGVTSRLIYTIQNSTSFTLIYGHQGISKSHSISLLTRLNNYISSYQLKTIRLTKMNSKQQIKYCSSYEKSVDGLSKQQIVPNHYKVKQQIGSKEYVIIDGNQKTQNKIKKYIYLTIPQNFSIDNLRHMLLKQCQNQINVDKYKYNNEQIKLKEQYNKLYGQDQVKIIVLLDQINIIASMKRDVNNILQKYKQISSIVQAQNSFLKQKNQSTKKLIDLQIDNKIYQKFGVPLSSIIQKKQIFQKFAIFLSKLTTNVHNIIYLSSMDIQRDLLQLMSLDCRNSCSQLTTKCVKYYQNKNIFIMDLISVFKFQLQFFFNQYFSSSKIQSQQLKKAKNAILEKFKKIIIQNQNYMILNHLQIRKYLNQLAIQNNYEENIQNQKDLNKFVQSIDDTLDKLWNYSFNSLQKLTLKFLNNDQKLPRRRQLWLRIYYQIRNIIKSTKKQKLQNKICLQLGQDQIQNQKLLLKINHTLFKIKIKLNMAIIQTFYPIQLVCQLMKYSIAQSGFKSIYMTQQEWIKNLRGPSYGQYVEDVIIDSLCIQNIQWKFKTQKQQIYFVMNQKVLYFIPLKKNYEADLIDEFLTNLIKFKQELNNKIDDSIILMPYTPKSNKQIQHIKQKGIKPDLRNFYSPAIDFIIMKLNKKKQLCFYIFDITTDNTSCILKFKNFIRRYLKLDRKSFISLAQRIRLQYHVLIPSNIPLHIQCPHEKIKFSDKVLNNLTQFASHLKFKSVTKNNFQITSINQEQQILKSINISHFNYNDIYGVDDKINRLKKIMNSIRMQKQRIVQQFDKQIQYQDKQDISTKKYIDNKVMNKKLMNNVNMKKVKNEVSKDSKNINEKKDELMTKTRLRAKSKNEIINQKQK